MSVAVTHAKETKNSLLGLCFQGVSDETLRIFFDRGFGGNKTVRSYR